MSHKKKILLVEDTDTDQLLFLRALRKIPNVELQGVVENGEEALNKLSALQPLPDLIFMDVDMPHMNGVQCLEAIMKNEHLKTIPVVMLSSSVQEAQHARTLGAKAFIKKTYDLDLLEKEIAQMIQLDFSADNEIADQSFDKAMM